MACPLVADGGQILHIGLWRLVANVMHKQQRTANKG